MGNSFKRQFNLFLKFCGNAGTSNYLDFGTNLIVAEEYDFR
jgi:hypothetical protein